MARLTLSSNIMKGLGGRNILYSQGKTLGGGSARNYLIYLRYGHGVFNFFLNFVNYSASSLLSFL